MKYILYVAAIIGVSAWSFVGVRAMQRTESPTIMDGYFPRDYQIELHNDTTWLYDGDRLVGITIDSTYSGKGLYDLIMTDNE